MPEYQGSGAGSRVWLGRGHQQETPSEKLSAKCLEWQLSVSDLVNPNLLFSDLTKNLSYCSLTPAASPDNAYLVNQF